MPTPRPKLPNSKTPGAVGRLTGKVGKLMQMAPDLSLMNQPESPGATSPVAGGMRPPKPLPKRPVTSTTSSSPPKVPTTPWKKGVIPDASTSQDDKMRKDRIAISSLAQVVRIEHESQVTYDANLASAADYMRRFLEWKGVDASSRSVGQYLQVMAEHLQQCDVTTNFRADQWFAQPNGSTHYRGMFEKHKANIDGRQQDVARATQSGGPDMRDLAETGKMFSSALESTSKGVRGKFNLIANAPKRFATTGGLTPMKVPGKNGAEDEVWKAANPHYIGATRPRYTALNYTGVPGGALATEGEMYGRSVLVWKDDLKRKSTFCLGDSFHDSVTAKSLCTYDTIGVLPAFMVASDDGLNVFQDLFELIFENKPAAPIPLWYVECHVYEELRFKGNLKCVRLHAAEAIGNVRANIEDFCKRKGVPLISV